MLRYHPSLPTEKDIKDEKNLPHSDHLPVMAEVPIGDRKEDSIRAISWNILHPTTPSGIGKMTSDQHHRRMSNIVRSLSIMTQSQPSTDIIFLQEASLDEFKGTTQKDNPLTTFLKENNEYAYIADSEKGLVTIYRKARFDEVQQGQNKERESKASTIVQGTIIHELREKNTGNSVVTHNVWLRHDDSPELHDQYVRDKLSSSNESPDKKIIIMGGDFNCRVVTPGKQNLVTGAVPPMFRTDNGFPDTGGQGCDWTDGFFYTDRDGSIAQPKILHTLEPETGIACDDKPIQIKNMPQYQQTEMTRFRPFMTVAKVHSIENLFGKEACEWLKDEYDIDPKQYSDANNNRILGFKKTNEAKFQHNSVDKVAYAIADHEDSLQFTKALLNHFQAELKKIEGNHLFLESGNKVYEEAKKILDSKDASKAERQAISKSLVNAINVIQNPLDPKAVQKLQQDAQQVRGAPSNLERFFGAVGMLAGAAIIGLSIAGIPFTGGASLIAAYAGGSLLMAGGAILFAHGRQKTLSKSLSKLASDVDHEQKLPKPRK